MKRLMPPLPRIAVGELPIPRQHLYAILMLAGFSMASVTLLPAPGELLSDTPMIVDGDDLTTDVAMANTDTEYLSIPDNELVDSDTVVGAEDADSNAAEDVDPPTMDYVVKADDNLSVIFNTLNLPAKTLQKLLEVDIQNSLIRLKPGQTLSFLIDSKNLVQQLSIPVSATERVVFNRKGDGYLSRLESLTDGIPQVAMAQPSPQTQATVSSQSSKPKTAVATSRVVKGKISSAFGTDARLSGLTANQIVQVTRLFQGRIDFRRDLRKGDSFKVLLDKPAAAGAPNRDAKVLAVVFSTKGRDYKAYRHSDGRFYDETASGFSSGTFMRYPIPSLRKVSSSFSPNRRNPVTGIVQPHNGTDFPARVGTPIVATGDGVVVKATSHPAAGRYIIIRHNGKYSTTYMHMSKLLVKAGQKVKQGQKIGLSGNTGRSTGPHLHYEFRINNRPVDPMRVDLPVNSSMGGKERASFLAKVREYNRLLAS